ncbi:hypothetical protein [Ruficoccus sp. ZRK36]|uniref:hypothetical protein n=1 Tax=Ruficoccus sp. ZRK36 TaxID=2866311 RepID=UPI001C730FA6|nr:hypothetical protein [Ruficoccus sp. ZRK36]QYY35365.1 hypothetical protein K0V07_13840 [Ruficoccus sp. ZRK36]
MSFWLYKCDGSNYTQLAPVKLTGPEGILARYLQSKSEENTPFTWSLLNKDIVALIDPELDASTHLVVLDMLPEHLVEVSLHRVYAIQGSSEEDTSDVVLACKILFQGLANKTSSTFKEAFECDPPADNRQMLEALGLSGGTAGGRYHWTKPKMDIGATVCT